MRRSLCPSFAFLLLLTLPAASGAEEDKWITLSNREGLKAWKGPTDDWMLAASVEMDPKNPKKLVAKPGEEILVNSPKGRARDLITKQSFGDIEAHVEYRIPKGSKSGEK